MIYSLTRMVIKKGWLLFNTAQQTSLEPQKWSVVIYYSQSVGGKIFGFIL